MDNDFPVALGGVTPQGFAQMYAKRVNDFSQAGTGIRPLHLQNREEQEAGGPIFNQFSASGTPDFESMGFIPGGTTIAGSPSFDINMPPDIDSPEVDAWLEEYRNSPGPKPPPITGDQVLRNLQRLRKSYRSGINGV